tara:strand:+ start:135 stop:506 length:372 start_codon:yes stop_codon:yes gene_type:complete
MPVQVGDLVGFYRRKSPGMGIILDKVDDVLYECGVDHDVAFQIAKNAEGRTYWEKREAVKDLCGGEYTEKPQMLKLFFQYNDKWCSKPKKSFVRIKWFKQPRAYEGRIAENEGWYPADWVRSK